MKRILQIFSIAWMSLVSLVSCGSDGSKDEPVIDNYLQVTPTSVSVDEKKQETEITIVSSAAPIITLSDNSWCSFTQSKKASQNGRLTTSVILSISENTSAIERSNTLTIANGSASATVSIKQSGAPEVDPTPTPTPTPIPGQTISDSSVDFAKSMALGWNLGNHMDASSNGVANETAWGNQKCTQATMDAVKAAGFSTVRIPVTWLGQFGAAPDYTINAAWLNRVAEIVGYARNAGLYAIINIHHDGSDSQYWLNIKKAGKDDAFNAEVNAQVKAIWTQIANKFKDEGHFLMFESFNEIHDGGWGWGDNRTDGGKQYAALDSWNQTFVDAVRSTGGMNADRFLGIASYCTNINIACFGDPWNTSGKGTRMNLPKDSATDRLLVSVHNYDLTEYTLEAKFGEWGHTSTKSNTKDREKEVVNDFKKLKDNFVDKGIGVYVGEFGCVNRQSEKEKAFQKYFLEYYCKVAHDNGIPCVLWDNGSTKTGKECHGYFNHATGKYIGYAEEPVKAMVKAWSNEDSSYTLQSIYDQAPN